MSAAKRQGLPPVLQEVPIVVVLRARHAHEYPPVIDALIEGGIRSVELTLSTAGAMEQLPGLIDRFGAAIDIGLGTITTEDEARSAIELGARYLVTPTANHLVVAHAVACGVPVFPGGLTPTELLAGWRSGAAAVKLFPAATVGVGYIAQLQGPFPEMPIIPSGGIGIEDAAAWLAAGCVAVSIGGPLLQDAFAGGSSAELTARARSLTAVVRDAMDSRETG